MMLVGVGGQRLRAAPQEVVPSVPNEALSGSRSLARP